MVLLIEPTVSRGGIYLSNVISGIAVIFLTSMLMLAFNINGECVLANGIWIIETVDSVEIVGWDTSLVLGSGGNPHISYYDYSNGDLKYAYYDGSWNLETVDSAGYVGECTSIALDNDSNPHISYYDWSNGDLKYAYHSNSVPWDITGPTLWVPDGKCEMRDIGLVATLFGSMEGDGTYDARADITGSIYLVKDGKIEMRDVGLVASHFGETYY